MEFDDPDGQLLTMLEVLDGRSVESIVSHVRQRHSGLSETDVHEGLRVLDQYGFLKDVDAREGSVEKSLIPTQNFFDGFHRVFDRKRPRVEAISEARVVVLGLGGGGSNVATMLVGAGVRQLTILDFDLVETGNLGRQFLYKLDDVGLSKVDVATRNLSRMAESLNITPVEMKVTSSEELRPIIKGADIVVCLIDEPRFLIQRMVNQACVREGVTCVYGFSFNFTGRVYSVIPHDSGCFDCLQVYYSRVDPEFADQFKALEDSGFRPPSSAYPPAMMQLCSSISDEVVRLINSYSEPMSVGRQLEVNYVSRRCETVLEWDRDERDCPTCGSGNYDDWPIFQIQNRFHPSAGQK
ncbi:ThiF family adenylyltransferase [Falsarthrobacter nasiphocae]|uniref:Molybdopterin/thiamine biosynthesis adenylyltransferase n=2 Tax=Falsarthrobacter nasiphocae TaxID=189863 RepID=A0AAE3YIT8_9MICC|nr:ThiF family adenylyltransferase [Falsarthrobacter nasiphocae]MDR6892753.1 molybdopterin/thiamine biosynthesis adenylyltransferase [Falsarthrobacter nasiphocae]